MRRKRIFYALEEGIVEEDEFVVEGGERDFCGM